MILESVAAVFSVGGAVYALSAKHLMRGILGLCFFFLGIAFFFAQLGAWFLAVGQVFLFIGGVVTLFVLAFNFANPPTQHGSTLTGLAVAVLVSLVLVFFLPYTNGSGVETSLASFAQHFFTNYGWGLNIAVFLLFSAIIGAQYLMTEDAA